ncbi:MAG TPA: glycosyltransferase family 9 protein [Dongiaceae bacterium]|nr:glycosyltransferase family 9 protein [Dongiaceae bacterium]
MPDPRFLVVRLGALGDIVHALPAVSGLRRSFPHAEIVWLTHPKWESLVASSGLASQIWTVDTRDISSLRSILKRIRRHRFDAAIDYQGLWKSASLPFLARVPRRIGFSSHTVREAGVPLLYTDRVRVNAAAHVTDQNAELSVRAGAHIPTSDAPLRVAESDVAAVRRRLAAADIQRYIVLSPGGGWRSKCWPAERYGALAAKIAEEFGLRSVINSGPGEEALSAQVIAAAGDATPIAFAGTLGELMALLRGADAVVAGDTGPLHLADALGARVVAIFGPTDPGRNGPYRRRGPVLRWENAQTTYKRGDAPDESLLHISAEDVQAALRGLRAVA